MAQFTYKNEFVEIPVDFITNQMTQINGEFVKVYLYAMYLAQNNKECTYYEIAKRLKLLESEVIRAFELFEEMGLISVNGEEVVFGKASSYEIMEIEENEESFKFLPAEEVRKNLTDNTVLAELCTTAEATYGKTMNDSDLEILYWMYNELLMSPEVILMVIEYCISNGKRSMQYIQRVAITWKENGINTMEDVKSFMERESERKGNIYRLRKSLGISDRPLSKSEDELLKKWCNEYEMSVPMIELAYDYCVMQTNRLSFQYMDSIIKNWYDNNIITVEQAQRDKENFKNAKNKKKDNDTKSNIKSDKSEYSNLAELTQNKSYVNQ